MRHNFPICDSENAIICGKICDMRVLAKYAIAYSHITNIPSMCHHVHCESQTAPPTFCHSESNIGWFSDLQNNFTDTLLRKFSSKVVVNDFTMFQICYYTCVQIIIVTDIFGPGWSCKHFFIQKMMFCHCLTTLGTIWRSKEGGKMKIGKYRVYCCVLINMHLNDLNLLQLVSFIYFSW